MKQAIINYAKNEKSDHFITPAYAITPLLPYIPKHWKIWECTDTKGDSLIPDILRERGCDVVSTGMDKLNFLFDKPDFDFDCIITNPPYTLKDEFIKQCYRYKKPWAMLMPLTTLEGVERGKWFGFYGIELLVFDKRVEFVGGGACWFSTGWFCHNILPEKLMFVNLEKPKKERL